MKRIFDGIMSFFLTIARGNILTKMGVHKCIPHIIFAFGVCMLSIILSYYADRTAKTREATRKELEDARIMYSTKYMEMVSLHRYTTVEDMLEEKGSQLRPLRNPVIELKQK